MGLVFVLCALPLAGILAADPESAARKQTVKLIVDYDDGVQKRFLRLVWQPEMTVLDVTQAASKHARGIRFKSRGRGATAFVYEIDGLKNEANGRAWLYQVNGKRGDRSCGKFLVKAGDTVLWEFGTY